jgi:glycosyltransferase involved in cell wall biosynthesis
MDIHGRLLSEGMVNRGHRVSLIGTRHPSGKNYEKRNGVKIYYLENTTFASRRKGWGKESLAKFFELHYHQPFDVIWSQSYDAFGFTRSDRLSSLPPLIPTLHGSIEQELKTFITNLGYRLKSPKKIASAVAGLFFSYFRTQKPLLHHANKIITVSKQVTDDLKKWFGHRIASKCITIPNGIDTSLFKPQPDQRIASRLKYGIGEHDILLLTLGRLTHEKGHSIALDAMRQLKDQVSNIKLLIVGSGEGRKNLEIKARKTGLEQDVIFTGSVENDETVKYYNAADIFVMPTLTVEGLPFVLLEAMSCEKPIIASRIGGNATVVRDGRNGLLIDPGSCDQLADKIRLLVNNRMLLEKLSAAARRTVKNNFSIQHMVDGTLDAIASVIGQRRSRP